MIKNAKNYLKNKLKNKKKGFAKGMCGYKLFLIFVIFSVFGVYYEQILNLAEYYLDEGIIFWEIRRGVLYGPFNPLYGFGAIIFVYFLAEKNYSNTKIFLLGSIIGGLIEYIICYLQEIFVSTTSWNYQGYFLNIGGRTTIPFMMVWGALSLLLVKKIYPKISNFIESMPYNFMKNITVFLAIFLSLDMFVSWTALFRQNYRKRGIPPRTVIGELYDKYYTDTYLQKHFPNMRFD